MQQNKKFIIRCPRNGFIEARKLFEEDSATSKIVTITMPCTRKNREKVKTEALPTRIKIRLVKVLLSTGEVEVLATSLLSDEEFPEEEFQYLYYLRWGVETFFFKD